MKDVTLPKRTFEILLYKQFPSGVIVTGSRPCTSQRDLNLKLIQMRKIQAKT